MGAESWAAFALALLVALAVPGPDLVLVVHSATRGVREGASTAVGIVAGLMLHALLAAAGATALLVSAPGALTIVQLLGAGVLLWMGASMLRTTRSTELEAAKDFEHQSRGGYARGFVTNATNPKALLFFAAILPQFIGHGDGAKMRTVALCAAVVLGAGLWWAVTIALIRLFGFHRSPAADRIITLLGGVALLLIGVGLLASTAYGLISPYT
ncbi:MULTISPECIES: LysE family translocator [Brevibacterium]|uniref:Threonine/homoserine/homoserine lactone efflux protein n=2 Tax=Brevibacterium TaxID=1696 RepID=A0A1H1LGN3_BRESA|nr:LysE family translocator [Brevibacterium sandarakinum]SDR73019.1 Threonine/homoserine/homoserine lactone efflux protein [Brevibacterium sandarakinum]